VNRKREREGELRRGERKDTGKEDYSSGLGGTDVIYHGGVVERERG